MTGFEPFLFEAAKSIAVLAIKTAWERANIRLDEPVKKLIFKASGQYIQNYTERHGILKVLGMREPIPLESVYVEVQCLNESELRGYDSIELLEQAYRESKQRQLRFGRPSKQPGLDIANQKQYLMVLAGPGMGKSTFLRKMGLEALKGKCQQGFTHACIPVFIELKLFRSGDIDIQGAIAQEFETCGFPDHERFTKTVLEQGKLLILLDGLDEVPTDRMSEGIQKIQNFVDCYGKNRFIASCRVAAYRHNFRRFTDVAIADFDDEQIQAFITNWFRSQPERGLECWNKLTSSDYAAAKELTHTPLLLTLACLLYQRAGQFPTNRATLYERALRVLLEEWAAEKELSQDHLYKGLDTKRKELMLSEIAHDAFQEDRLFLSRRELVQQIEGLLKEMLPDEKFIDGAAVLRSMEVQHGVLVEQAEGIYSFSHLTLQEFLTAQHIVEEPQRVEDLVTNRLGDERWIEVFLLLAGLKKADDLLLRMHQQAQTYLTPRAKELLQWADQITTGLDENNGASAKRALALALAFVLDRDFDFELALALAQALNFDRVLKCVLAFAQALDFDRVISSTHVLTFDLELAHDLELASIFKDVNLKRLIAKLEALKMKTSSRQLSDQEKIKLTETIQQLWLETLKLTPELTYLPERDAVALTTYLNANLLIVQCRKAAVRVSPLVWETIESRMLQA